MSFRLFIYYCALCGGWAAFFAWGLALLMDFDVQPDLVRTCAYGAVVGLFVAAAVGAVDALLNAAPAQRFSRTLVSLTVGLFGGLLGSALGQVLYSATLSVACLILGWMLTGLAIGLSISVFDWVSAMAGGQGTQLALGKVRNGVLGGALGGLLGSLLYVVMEYVIDLPRASKATGLVVLGSCIGLLIGLAQVILKEAWVKIESGVRPGREMMLAKVDTTIGRAEACDIGLFGDNTIDRVHARIMLQDNHYFLVDGGSGGGTFLNGGVVTAPALLHSGDEIRVGKSVLRFGERRQQPKTAGGRRR